MYSSTQVLFRNPHVPKHDSALVFIDGLRASPHSLLRNKADKLDLAAVVEVDIITGGLAVVRVQQPAPIGRTSGQLVN